VLKNKMKNKYIILAIIVLLGTILRFYKLGQIPVGFHQDEVSQAYNAFSILHTLHDRYGQLLPILFRSFGSYQPPVYTYLASIPILIFGNTFFAARFVSAFAGTLVIIITYLISRLLVKKEYSEKFALISSFVVAVSPWAIHFSRRVVEGNLGIMFFLLAFYLLLKSLSKINLFPLAAFVMGIATHAYYSERVIGLVFIGIFVICYWKYFWKEKKWLFFGAAIFGLVMIPHVITIILGAFTARFNQVRYSGESVYLIEFFRHFVSYLSPKNLFSDIGSDLGRISPGLSVYYSWFFVPFLAGIYYLPKFIKNKFSTVLGILLPVTLIPVSMTGDVFYPLRALVFFWFLSLVVSSGLIVIFDHIKLKQIKFIVASAFIIYSLGSFYVSYFVLSNYETTENVGETYIKLIDELKKYNNYSIIIDDPRDPAMGLRLAYLKKFDPVKLQVELIPQMTTSYYNSYVNQGEMYVIDNITTRMVNWTKDPCDKNVILVGDNLTFSDTQIAEHRLSKIFELTSANKDFTLRGFSTNPDRNCKPQ